MATGPDLRIGDADREAAAAMLREHYAQGRLTLEEFNQRLDATFSATTRSHLDQITHGLPPAPAPSAPLPVAAVGGGRERAREEQQARGARPRLGLIPVILAALATWLVVFDLHLRMFPWPGRLAIFLALLAAIRGVLRRMFGLRRGRMRARRCGGRGGRFSGDSWSQRF